MEFLKFFQFEWFKGIRAAVLISTLMSVFGIFIPAIGWGWTLASWGYAFIWFLIFDRLKLALYPIFDRQQVVLRSKGKKRSLLASE